MWFPPTRRGNPGGGTVLHDTPAAGRLHPAGRY